ncbi:unnamed protein product, partial [Rotaria magnacalcarata]
YFNHSNALALSQRVIGLYTLTLNISTFQLNSFARNALSQLTSTFDPDLYEDFIEAWGTHIITKSLIGGMIEERAKVTKCFLGTDDRIVAGCIPFSGRGPTNSSCAYYADQTQILSTRRLGGNAEIENDDDWRRTIAAAPALLQILEMIPWNDFVTDETVKQNLRTIIRYRQRNTDFVQTEAVRHVDTRLATCIPGDGTILGIGKNNQLYTRVSMNHPWIHVPDSGSMIGVSNLKDGTILGVGTNNQLYTRATISSSWVNVPDSGNIVSVTILKDGTILGVSTDTRLYTRATLRSPWILIHHSGAVLSVTVLKDGTILGAHTNQHLYTRATVTSHWVHIANGYPVIGVTVLNDGTILGVGPDNHLYTRAVLQNPWMLAHHGASVIAVASYTN